MHFIRTDLISQIVHYVAQIERVEHPHSEINCELETGFSRCRFDTVVLLKQQDAKAVEPGVLQRKAILGFIHSEAAGAKRAGRKKDIIIQDFLSGNPLFFKSLQVLNKIADSEVGGVALAIIPVLFAELKGCDIRSRHHLALISVAMEDGLDEL